MPVYEADMMTIEAPELLKTFSQKCREYREVNPKINNDNLKL